ncbi:MAG TPA: T9SS type A sorting domain-containing protein [Bacteroidales bacterium]|nr:T9SS type A sorting domain-containing protein [Bacteroidales bacterium]
MSKYILIFLGFVYASVTLQAQEYLSPIMGNPVLRSLDSKVKKQKVQEQYLTLPFIDDFSTPGPFPDATRWIDRKAFVNHDYAVFPPTVGVASLDIVDENGKVYENASISAFRADELTSQFIRLDSLFGTSPRPLSPADSIYLSFWYQPQGLGNSPEPNDVLLLQFLEIYRFDTIIDSTSFPIDTVYVDKWTTVWSAEGQTLDAFYKEHGSYFTQVMIPVMDPLFFRKDFRFRFVSYGSMADHSLPSWQSNVDHWHLDYVYMDMNRTGSQKSVQDIAFANRPGSMLKYFDAMPYHQYSIDPLKHMLDSLRPLITNLGVDTPITRFSYFVEDAMGGSIHSFDGGTFNLAPFAIAGYQNYPQHAQPPVAFSFPPGSADSTWFKMQWALSKTGLAGDIVKTNDTVEYVQHFGNYYAYDDGTAEAGYGLTPAGSKLAYRFGLNQPDTLTSIRMYFNQTSKEANQQFFFLTVWANNKGKPGEVLWTKENVRATYGPSLNAFVSFEVDAESPLILTDTFFIGWVQKTDDNLNVGYDRHRNAQQHIFYSLDGGPWQNSSFEGCLMIRPVFGKRIPPSGKDKTGSGVPQLGLYPNPAKGNDMLRFDLLNKDAANDPRALLRIFDASGRMIWEVPYADQITLPGLGTGLYVIRVFSSKLSAPAVNRLIISQ